MNTVADPNPASDPFRISDPTLQSMGLTPETVTQLESLLNYEQLSGLARSQVTALINALREMAPGYLVLSQNEATLTSAQSQALGDADAILAQLSTALSAMDSDLQAATRSGDFSEIEDSLATLSSLIPGLQTASSDTETAANAFSAQQTSAATARTAPEISDPAYGALKDTVEGLITDLKRKGAELSALMENLFQAGNGYAHEADQIKSLLLDIEAILNDLGAAQTAISSYVVGLDALGQEDFLASMAALVGFEEGRMADMETFFSSLQNSVLAPTLNGISNELDGVDGIGKLASDLGSLLYSIRSDFNGTESMQLTIDQAQYWLDAGPLMSQMETLQRQVIDNTELLSQLQAKHATGTLTPQENELFMSLRNQTEGLLSQINRLENEISNLIPQDVRDQGGAVFYGVLMPNAGFADQFSDFQAQYTQARLDFAAATAVPLPMPPANPEANMATIMEAFNRMASESTQASGLYGALSEYIRMSEVVSNPVDNPTVSQEAIDGLLSRLRDSADAELGNLEALVHQMVNLYPEGQISDFNDLIGVKQDQYAEIGTMISFLNDLKDRLSQSGEIDVDAHFPDLQRMIDDLVATQTTISEEIELFGDYSSYLDLSGQISDKNQQILDNNNRIIELLGIAENRYLTTDEQTELNGLMSQNQALAGEIEGLNAQLREIDIQSTGNGIAYANFLDKRSDASSLINEITNSIRATNQTVVDLRDSGSEYVQALITPEFLGTIRESNESILDQVYDVFEGFYIQAETELERLIQVQEDRNAQLALAGTVMGDLNTALDKYETAYNNELARLNEQYGNISDLEDRQGKIQDALREFEQNYRGELGISQEDLDALGIAPLDPNTYPPGSKQYYDKVKEEVQRVQGDLQQKDKMHAVLIQQATNRLKQATEFMTNLLALMKDMSMSVARNI